MLLCAACTGAATTYDEDLPDAGGPAVPGRAFGARVDRVVDGDTLIALRTGRRLRVRLIGVDAPESVMPGAPVECFGRRASRVLATLLPTGTRVRAAYQPGGRRDRYERELWDVWLRDGTFVQGELVRRGAAEARAYPPHTTYADVLERIERRARGRRVGLWGAC